ncbi:MAG: TonB-dependent receptor [Flavobacteriaceae bacterium]|nr:TonB-dependent receptor [Flavobacteriaceae bacterium]MDG2313986.1 TonB-dependent receptor [Flavobacteriaceae bacterium]
MNKIFILIIAFSFYSFAQSDQVSGTVLDSETKDPLPGATVLVKGTTIGTTTDFDGNFSLPDISVNTTLVVSYLGYTDTEIKITASATYQILLNASANELQEIVVVGYGTQTKKEVTGAVTVLGAENIEKLNPTRIEQALQGQVSGVNITSGSGAPGSGLNIQIRGVSTNGDNRPLILLDGNVIEDLSVLNPKDIESINVIKDATAGIYGVRGANGVILITTKTGRKNTKLSIELDSYFGIQLTSKKIDLMQSAQYTNYSNDLASFNIYKNTPTYSIDWQNKVFEMAPMTSTNLSVSGGTEKSTYTAGVSYLYQDGIVGLNKSNFNRLTSRIKYQYDVLDNLKINTSVIYMHSEKNNLPEGGIGSVLYSAVNMSPLITVYNGNDYNELNNPRSYSLIKAINAVEIINPVAQIYNANNTSLVDKFTASLGVDYSPWSNVKISSVFQMNHANVLNDVYRPVAYYGSSKSANRTKVEVVDHGSTFDDYTWDNFLTYENTFNDLLNMKILLGTSIFKTKGIFYGYSFEDGDEAVTPRFNADDKFKGADVFDSRLASVFYRIQLNYDNRYLLSGVVRRDGSSKFSPKNKFGIFPSASLGWNISEENFFSSTTINNLKLRLSYGIIGNDRIGDFGFISRLNGEAVYSNNLEETEDDLLRGVAVGKLSNPEIRWEKQKTGNFGVDMSLFDSSLRISLDAYQRETEDLLIDAQVSGILGASAPGSGSPFINAGTVRNQGLEASIAYNTNFTDDLSFNISYNISTIDNEVLFVESENGFQQGGGWGVGLGIIPSRMEAGYPLGYFYGYKTNGLYQNQAEIDALDSNAFDADGEDIYFHEGAEVGDLKFVDVNGDGYISDDDKTYIGDPIPDFTMGFSMGFQFKDFDFSASAYASIGNDMVRDYERQAMNTNRGTYMLNRWTPETGGNTIPRASGGSSINNNNFSDYFVEDASYLRIQNVQLGYTANDKINKFLRLDSLRMYVSANNLFTFTNYNGFDPSASGGSPIGAGIDKGFYPVSRTFMFGLNVKL